MRFLSDTMIAKENKAESTSLYSHLSLHNICPFLPGSEKQDFFEQVPVIIRELIHRLNDDDATVLSANHAAFTALSAHVPAEELVKNVEFMRNLLASLVSDARRRKGGVGDGEFLLPGLNMPKGTSCVVLEEYCLRYPKDEKFFRPDAMWGI